MDHMRGLIVSGIAILLVALPRTAWGEGYIAVEAGGGFPTHEDALLSQSMEGSVVGPAFPGYLWFAQGYHGRFHVGRMEFGDSFLWGGKAGWFFDTSVLGGNPGLEIESYHFSPDVHHQVAQALTRIRISGLPDVKTASSLFIGDADVGVTALAINALWRHPFRKSPSHPHGRFQIYFGPGVGLYIEHYNPKGPVFPGTARKDDTDTEFGLQAVGGGKFFVTRRIAIFGEYRVLQTGNFDLRFSAGGVDGLGAYRVTDKFSHDLAVQQVVGGLAFHFQ
jgi:opacity protein-like surface antigen